jgi:hypothetical protein
MIIDAADQGMPNRDAISGTCPRKRNCKRAQRCSTKFRVSQLLAITVSEWRLVFVCGRDCLARW